MRRSLVTLVAVTGAVACCEPSAPRSAIPGPSAALGPQAIPAYPRTYPLVGEAELRRREAEAEARNQGWQIVLKPEGLLSFAVLLGSAAAGPRPPDTKYRPSSGEEERARDFLTRNVELLGGDVAASVAEEDQFGMVFRQNLAATRIAEVRIVHLKQGLLISGHFWPGLTPPPSSITEDQARVTLEAAEPPSSGMPLKRQSRLVARTEAGPIEVHFCLELSQPRDQPPREHPCVDLVSGAFVEGKFSTCIVRGKGGAVIHSLRPIDEQTPVLGQPCVPP